MHCLTILGDEENSLTFPSQFKVAQPLVVVVSGRGPRRPTMADGNRIPTNRSYLLEVTNNRERQIVMLMLQEI